LDDYNGVDVNQTAEHIELTACGYINRVLLSHGWDTPSPNESVAENRRTKHWEIRFRRKTTDLSLSPGMPYNLSIDPDLPPFPAVLSLLQLTGYVDAAHANDLRNRRSTTGYGFTLNGGAIAYRSKTQSVTATSSTEAEFIAAVSAAKSAKYLRTVLLELGFPHLH
jgi:hypothetical protein